MEYCEDSEDGDWVIGERGEGQEDVTEGQGVDGDQGEDEYEENKECGDDHQDCVCIPLY